jgi:hypothetical protein
LFPTLSITILRNTNWPPDWFRSQPFQPWFRPYADQMRRISFVNREGRRQADIVLLYPQVSIWGQAAPAFSEDASINIMANSNWSPDAVETAEQYDDLKMRLTRARYDFMVADDEYLAQSEIGGGRLRINKAEFQVLILTPHVHYAPEDGRAHSRLSTGRVEPSSPYAACLIPRWRMAARIAQLKAIWEEVFDLASSVQPLRPAQRAAAAGDPIGCRFRDRPRGDRSRPWLILTLNWWKARTIASSPCTSGTRAWICYWVVNDKPEPRTLPAAIQGEGPAGKMGSAHGRSAFIAVLRNAGQTRRWCAWCPGTRGTPPTWCLMPLAR